MNDDTETVTNEVCEGNGSYQYAKVPTALLRDPNITIGAKALYGLLDTWTSKGKDYCFASQEVLAKYLNVSARTLRSYLAELVEGRWVTVDRQNRRRHNRYFVHRIPDLNGEFERKLASSQNDEQSLERKPASSQNGFERKPASYHPDPADSIQTQQQEEGASAPPKPPPAEVEKWGKNHKDHPAVQTYREIARLWPEIAVRPDIVVAVGEDEDDVAFWSEVVKAWIATGWSKRNVAGMLDCYGRRELPGTRAGNGRAGPGQRAPTVDRSEYAEYQE
jgi:hypothetical protein